MEVHGMAPWMTIVLYKQVGFHVHDSSSLEFLGQATPPASAPSVLFGQLTLPTYTPTPHTTQNAEHPAKLLFPSPPHQNWPPHWHPIHQLATPSLVRSAPPGCVLGTSVGHRGLPRGLPLGTAPAESLPHRRPRSPSADRPSAAAWPGEVGRPTKKQVVQTMQKGWCFKGQS